MCIGNYFRIPEGPLPEESHFVVENRENIPASRITTAMSRGRATVNRATGRATEETTARARGRATAGSTTRRGRAAATDQAQLGRGRGGTRARVASIDQESNGRGRGATRARGNASTATRNSQNGTGNAGSGTGRGRVAEGYNTGPGSTYHLLFSDDGAQNQNPDETASTQNGPHGF
jgi:hypothetical protein